MSNTIGAETLKNLRGRRILSQADLVRITAENRNPVSLSTIKRIEDAKQPRRTINPRTIRALASALNVNVEELTGKSCEPHRDDEHLNAHVPVRDKIDRQTDLSYQAVEAVYGISRSAQIAMAPLFAALLAEASLKWRQERLEALGSIGDRLDTIRGDNPLLTGAFARVWEAEKIEKWSLEKKDVLGHRALERLKEGLELAASDLDTNYDYHINSRLPFEWVSPFILFLKDFSSPFQKSDIKMELGDDEGDPQIPNGIVDYRVGADFIDEICGDNAWARIAIEYGHASLTDIPPDLLSSEKAIERQAYLASQMTADKRWEHAKARLEQSISDMAAMRRAGLERGLDENEGPLAVTDELIAGWIAAIERRQS